MEIVTDTSPMPNLARTSFPRKRESICSDAKAKMDDQLALLKSASRFRGNDVEENSSILTMRDRRCGSEVY
jgi:hypothetical protein